MGLGTSRPPHYIGCLRVEGSQVKPTNPYESMTWPQEKSAIEEPQRQVDKNPGAFPSVNGQVGVEFNAEIGDGKTPATKIVPNSLRQNQRICKPQELTS